MRLTKPKFWDTKNFISFILYPLSAITYLIKIAKKLSKKKNLRLKLSVLVIYSWVAQAKPLWQ